MKFNRRFSFAIPALSGLFIMSSGCGDKEEVGERPVVTAEEPVVVETVAAPLQLRNTLSGLAGDLYSSQADSPIHWQVWGGGTFESARTSERLILGVIAMSQQPYHHEVFRQMEEAEGLVDLMNRKYVPVLIDGDVMREMRLLASSLCSEIGVPTIMPLMVWFSAEGNPISWLPLLEDDNRTIPELIVQSHLTVDSVWKDDPEYVVRNSRELQERRGEVHAEMEQKLPNIEKVDEDVVKSLRYLVSLYDPMARRLNDSGGLFPDGVIKMLTLGAQMEGIAPFLRQRCEAVLRLIMEDLQDSAMFDPLDGGVYSSRRGISWSLPGYYRDCATQAAIATNMLNAYEVIEDERTLARALGVIGYCEEAYRNDQGLFTLVQSYSMDLEHWLWRTNDLRGLLTADEFRVWKIFSGMDDGGNLADEVDPMNEAGDLNTISVAKEAGAVAEELGWQEERVQALLEAAIGKLSKVREERITRFSGNERAAHAVSTFRMVSAYCAAYRATGEDSWLEKAVELGAASQEAFSDGPRLNSYAGAAPKEIYTGRAFVYGVVLNAVLDLAASTLDESWNLWADNLATTSAEYFLIDDLLSEAPVDLDVPKIRIADMTMLFGNSSLGELSLAEARLTNSARNFLPSFSERLRQLPVRAITKPVMYSDLLTAALVREYGSRLIYNSQLGEEQRKAVSRLPAEAIARVPVDLAAMEDRKLMKDDLLLLGPEGQSLLPGEVLGQGDEPLLETAE